MDAVWLYQNITCKFK